MLDRSAQYSTNAPDAAAAGRPAARPMRFRGRLFRKLAVLLVALVASALSVVTAFEAWNSYVENRAALVAIQREKAQGAAAVIEQFLREIESQLGWATHAAATPGQAGPDQRRLDFLRLLRQAPAITEVTHVDTDGREQLRVSRLAMDVVNTGSDRSAEPLIREALANRRAVSPVYFRKESEPYLTLAITGASRRGGVTVAEVNLKFIWDVISRIKVGKAGIAYAVDARGLLIAHPDIGLVLRKTDMSGLEQVKQARSLEAGAPQPAIATDRTGRDVLTAHATVDPVGWRVFVEQPLEEAFAPIYASVLRTGILSLVGLVVAGLVGLWLAQRLTVPIEALSQGAARLGAGEFGHRIAVKTGDEVEALADRFNEMGARLKESYAGLERKVEERTRDLNEALAQQTATADVLKAISRSAFDLETVLNTLIQTGARLCDAPEGVIWLRKGAEYRLAACVGYSQEWVALARSRPVVPDLAANTTSGIVTATGEMIHVEDFATDPRFNRGDAYLVGGYRSALMLPLMRNGGVEGTIGFTRHKPGLFTPRQVELVKTFADQAVIAIENARLFEEVQARTRELQESLEYQIATSEVLAVISTSPNDHLPVLDVISRTAARLCASDGGGAIYMLQGGRYHYVLGYWPDEDDPFPAYAKANPVHPGQKGSVTARAAQTGRPVHVVDSSLDPEAADGPLGVGPPRTVLAVPFMRDGVAMGVVVLRRASVRPFEPRQIDLVGTFADQAVIAIENARLFEEVQARTRELTRSLAETEALGKVGQTVSSSLDLQEVLATVLSHACDLAQAGGGTIYVIGEDGDTLALAASHNMSDMVVDTLRACVMRLADSPSAQAIVSGRSEQIADLREQAGNAIFDTLCDVGIRALLGVPLRNQDRTIGILFIGRDEPGAFSPETVSLLEAFASQSAIALNNARLFRELEEKGEQLRVASLHKSQFLANMSHELRTPLNAILGYTELIQDGVYGDVSPKLVGILERVQTNGRHLLGLINDVLDLSKIEAGQLTLRLEEYAMPEIIQTVVSATEALATEKKLALSAKIEPGLPIGQGDQQRITQVLLNLVGNAIKFTDRGSVTISVRARASKFVVKVADTGPGIPAAEQARIFEEFHQVDSSNTKKKGGTGLGLAISRRIIALHGGRISVESTLGEGSTFRFDLPVRVERQRGL